MGCCTAQTDYVNQNRTFIWYRRPVSHEHAMHKLCITTVIYRFSVHSIHFEKWGWKPRKWEWLLISVSPADRRVYIITLCETCILWYPTISNYYISNHDISILNISIFYISSPNISTYDIQWYRYKYTDLTLYDIDC